mmetsp:Transcript_59702/g.142049  ORF Transcript_59702/g.142049 Transcript_59702/m.142049 type:complete len:315 (+) Transcript_59702:390-1334(+)
MVWQAASRVADCASWTWTQEPPQCEHLCSERVRLSDDASLEEMAHPHSRRTHSRSLLPPSGSWSSSASSPLPECASSLHLPLSWQHAPKQRRGGKVLLCRSARIAKAMCPAPLLPPQQSNSWEGCRVAKPNATGLSPSETSRAVGRPRVAHCRSQQAQMPLSATKQEKQCERKQRTTGGRRCCRPRILAAAVLRLAVGPGSAERCAQRILVEGRVAKLLRFLPLAAMVGAHQGCAIQHSSQARFRTLQLCKATSEASLLLVVEAPAHEALVVSAVPLISPATSAARAAGGEARQHAFAPAPAAWHLLRHRPVSR